MKALLVGGRKHMTLTEDSGKSEIWLDGDLYRVHYYGVGMQVFRFYRHVNAEPDAEDKAFAAMIELGLETLANG